MIYREVKAVAWFIVGYIVLHLGFFLMALRGDLSWLSFLQQWNPTSSILFFVLLQELILLFLLYSIRKRQTGMSRSKQVALLRERRQRKGWGPVWTYVISGLALYFVGNMLLLGVLSWVGWDIPGLYGEQMVMSMLEGLAMTQWREYLSIGLLVAIIAPMVEEIIFRGAMTHAFMKQWGGQGVVLASLVFAAIHAERAVAWNLVILSLFLGYIYRKTESMRYSFLFHFAINGLAVLVLILSQLYPELITM